MWTGTYMLCKSMVIKNEEQPHEGVLLVVPTVTKLLHVANKKAHLFKQEIAILNSILVKNIFFSLPKHVKMS